MLVRNKLNDRLFEGLPPKDKLVKIVTGGDESGKGGRR